MREVGSKKQYQTCKFPKRKLTNSCGFPRKRSGLPAPKLVLRHAARGPQDYFYEVVQTSNDRHE